MCSQAGVDTDAIANHTLRATATSRLYEQGVKEKQIMETSGHQSVSSVRAYERTTVV